MNHDEESGGLAGYRYNTAFLSRKDLHTIHHTTNNSTI